MKKLLFILLLAAALVMHVLLLWKPKPPPALRFRKVSFNQLPGWKTTDMTQSLVTFQQSCNVFLKQQPAKQVGSQFVDLQAQDWHPVCQDALRITTNSSQIIKEFFQKWFVPVEFFDNKPVKGLFTGYYMSQLNGSLNKTKKYHIPIYGMPNNLIFVDLALFDPALKNRRIVGRVNGKHFVPYFTREEINKGAIAHDASVIAWVDNHVDRMMLEIQGSGQIKLTDGAQLVVNYAGENGAPYTSIAKVLIDQGAMTKDNASMQRIRRYLGQHPEQLDTVLNQNKSFVFFEKLPHPVALGSQGIALTPGYSMAIDRKWIPMGTPIWVSTTRPHATTNKDSPFNRLMIAQDTGGAIRGPVRGDIYWGAGERASTIAGRMKNPGHYWLLLPKPVLAQLQDKLVPEPESFN